MLYCFSEQLDSRRRAGMAGQLSGAAAVRRPLQRPPRQRIRPAKVRLKHHTDGPTRATQLV